MKINDLYLILLLIIFIILSIYYIITVCEYNIKEMFIIEVTGNTANNCVLGLNDVNKLKKLEEFYDVDGSFELDFAVRYGKLYKSFCHVDEICKHIGDISAYDLNTSRVVISRILKALENKGKIKLNRAYIELL